MKKLICLCVITLGLVGCFASCGNGSDDKKTTEDVKVINFDTTRQEETTKKIKDKKKYELMLTVDVIPDEYKGNVTAYAESFGYEILNNEDGKVTFKMDGTQYKKLLSRTGVRAMANLGKIVDSDEFPYAEKIGDYDEDFGYILILANSKKFQKAENTEVFASAVAQCGIYYQKFCNPTSPSCNVVIADSESGKVLFKETYTQ